MCHEAQNCSSLDLLQKFYIPPASVLTIAYRPINLGSPRLAGGSEAFCSAGCAWAKLESPRCRWVLPAGLLAGRQDTATRLAHGFFSRLCHFCFASDESEKTDT